MTTETRDLVTCILCGAVLTYETRAIHLAWHARLNARLFTEAKK